MTDAIYGPTDEVIVSGTVTGVGDIEGRVIELNFDKLSQEYFYVVRAKSGEKYRGQERFISKK